MEAKPRDMPMRIEAIKYWWREWYTKVTMDSGRVIHYGPWNTRTAAQILADIFVRHPRKH